MHGGGTEYRKQGQHMRSIPTRGSRGTTRAIDCDPALSSSGYFCKDGRKICVGDTALFKSPHDSPHFIGIIRWLTSKKEGKLHLYVNRLYRPVELKLGKGILLDTVPNEVFYSFHTDEIPAKLLLHPCKVAFLPKGVELPSGVSSFVCRRVFDGNSRSLRWLTDQGYFDEQQEEVDQLLYKSQIEMHAMIQSGGRSPKPVNGPTSSQLKTGSDNVHAATSTSQTRGRKRERADQGSEPVKREWACKGDDGDPALLTSESVLKLELSRITEKGGLVNSDAVDKLVQLMQPNKVERKLELVSRSMFVGVIAVTENFDCLSRFVQLKGLPVLDQWLQDVHKGKVGNRSPKDGDKSTEEFLLILLRALDKLPVNLQALQMCNIGKSVNHLRTYKNSEIQKKARSLVDTWKKRVEDEMNVIDAKSGSNQAATWPSRTRLPEGSHGGNWQSGGSSEVAIKSSAQLSASKIASSKPVQGEMVAKATSSTPGPIKVVLSPTSGKDGQPRSVVGSNPDLPSTTARDERSSSSSQSHNNSLSCSSDHAKTTGCSGKEDARSSTAGSISVNKVSGGSSRPRRSVSCYPGSAPSGNPRETGSSRNSTLFRNLTSEKLSQSGLTCEKALALPTIEGSSQKLIVKIPNRGRSPAQSASVGPVDDPTVMHSRASSPLLSEKHDHSDHDSKEKADANVANNTSDVKTESWQSNDFKDILTGSDEGDGSPNGVREERYINGGDDAKVVEISKAVPHSSRNELESGRLHDASFSSMDAVIESCVKYSPVNASLSGGDDGGMNLLASVAAGEMSKSDVASPDGSCGRTANTRDDYYLDDDCKSKALHGNDFVEEQCQSEDGLHDASKQGNPLSTSELAGEKEAHNSSKLDSETAVNLVCQIKEQSNEFRDTVSVAPPPSAADKALISEEGKQLVEKAKTASFSGVSKHDSSLSNDNKVDEVASCPEVKKEAASSLDIDSENKADVRELGNDGRYTEQKPSIDTKAGVREGCNGSCKDLPSGSACKLDNIKLEDMESESQVRKQRTCRGISNASPDEGHRGCITSDKADESNESEFSAAHAGSLSASESAHVNKKPKFDLNEGFSVDDGKLGEPMNWEGPGFPVSAHIVNSLPFPVAPMSSGLPASITVAAAAKGPFVPPMDLLRSKRELGWKGSAATSAFRPAEPRKAPEVPHVANTPDAGASRPSRPMLEFDLNVADERTIEDVTSRNSAIETASTSAHGTIHELPLKKSLVSPPSRCSGDLDLDLNRVDEAGDMWQGSTSSGRGLEAPFFPANKSLSLCGHPNSNSKRDFDLNNGPILDDTVEPSLHNEHNRSNVLSQPFLTGLRTSTDGTSWFPAGNAFPSVAIPSILSERGDQAFPIVAAGGLPRVLGPPTGAVPFGPDLYRGSVLSSSPAVPFPSFQYPVFPFGTGFPLPSASLSGGPTTYTDSLSNARLGFSAPNSQLLSGPPPSITSNYSRPYAVSLPDGSNNMGVCNSSKWVKQGLDLNAGPATVDIEGRDESSALVPRQLSVSSSLALAEEQGKMFQQVAGGVLKRKESADNFRYRQTSWQ